MRGRANWDFGAGGSLRLGGLSLARVTNCRWVYFLGDWCGGKRCAGLGWKERLRYVWEHVILERQGKFEVQVLKGWHVLE